MFGIVSFCCCYWNWTCLVTWELFDEIKQKLGLYITNMVYVRELNKDFETTCTFFLPLGNCFMMLFHCHSKQKLNSTLISLLTYVLTWLEAVSLSLLFHLYTFRRSLRYVELRFGVQEFRKMFFFWLILTLVVWFLSWKKLTLYKICRNNLELILKSFEKNAMI